VGGAWGGWRGWKGWLRLGGGGFTRVVARVDPFRVPLCRLKKLYKLTPPRNLSNTPRTTFRFRFPFRSPFPQTPTATTNPSPPPPPRERKSKANFPGARRKGGGGAKYPSRKAAGRDIQLILFFAELALCFCGRERELEVH